MQKPLKFKYDGRTDTWIAKAHDRTWVFKKATCVVFNGQGDVLDIMRFDSTHDGVEEMEKRFNRTGMGVRDVANARLIMFDDGEPIDIGVTEAEAREIVKQELGL